MKKLNKIAEIYNNKELKEMAFEQQEICLRAKIDDALTEFNKNEYIQYMNKCKSIILEGISYMSNNYLANKVIEFEKK